MSTAIIERTILLALTFGVALGACGYDPGTRGAAISQSAGAAAGRAEGEGAPPVNPACEDPAIGVPPALCPDLYQPVCGRDGKTYASPCLAQQACVHVDYEGPCIEAPPPVGGTRRQIEGQAK